MKTTKLSKYIFISLVIATIYYAAGIVVKPLILPLTFSAPIWPQAGITVGILILWGNKYLPALVLGEILTNYRFYKFDQIFDHPYLLLTYLLMLVAMILRGLIGAYLYKRNLGQSNNILTLQSVIKLFLYTGVIPTFIAATLSTFALNLSGLLDKDVLLLNLFTWWYGDTIGVFITLPLMFLFFKQPREVWKPRLLKTAIPVMITFALILLISYNLKQFDYKRLIETMVNKSETLQIELFTTTKTKITDDNHQKINRHIRSETKNIIKNNNLTDIYFTINYSNSNTTEQLYHSSIKHKKSQKWRVQSKYIQGGNEWEITAIATSKFFINNASWLVWWLVAIGYLFIALVAGALLVITGNQIITNTTVKKRTKEINELNNILVEREKRYKQLVEIQPVIFWKHIIGNDKFDFISDEAVNILGYSKKELTNYAIVWNKMFHPDDRNKVLQDYYRGIKTRERFSLKYRGIKKNGDIIWFKDYISTHMVDNKLEVIGLKIDITKDQEYEQKIAQLAYYDTMTKLPNREKFMEYLNESLEFAKTNNTYGAVLYLDLDRFKVLNDSMGHYFGDVLLTQIAKKLKKTLRITDIASRFGGDEFVILIRNQNNKLTEIQYKAKKVAKKIQNMTKEPFDIDGHQFYTSFSIGISIFPENSTQPEEILQQADIAMYASKAKGKNTANFFKKEMQTIANQRLAIEKSLNTALQENQFEMYYQPIVDNGLTIIRLESLIRWNHPTEGLLMPDHFIHIAEETGFIKELSEWIINDVFQKLKKLQKKTQLNIPISINISLFQFKDSKLLEILEKSAKTHEINTSLVTLELTESIGIDNFDDALVKLNAIKKLGFQIAIDDFGSGYSSLNYLTKMPIDILKLDKSFMSNISKESNAEMLIEIIILMAKKLNLDIIIEGVETQKQFLMLKKLNCKYYQGFLFHSVLKYKKVVKLLMDTSIN